MPKTNKYLYGWKLWVNYGQGWEYELFEETLRDIGKTRSYIKKTANIPKSGHMAGN